MGNYYSTDHFAEDHIHTDITCNIEEPQQKYRLRTVSNRLDGRVASTTTYSFIINPLYTGGLYHCYILDKTICHFRGVRSVLSLSFYF